MRHSYSTNWTNEFEDIDFGDQRLNNRMIGMAAAFSDSFSKPLSQIMKDWASQKAAYRFFSNDLVDENEIIRVHREATMRRAAGQKRLIAVQDTTAFNFHKYRHLISGLGIIGQRQLEASKTYGLQMHASLLLTEAGETLGLADWSLWAPGRAIQEESSVMKWFNHLNNIAEISSELQTNIVMVADREADITGLLIQARKCGIDVVLRGKKTRRICLPEGGSLLYYLQRQPSQGEYDITFEKRYETIGHENKEKRTVHKAQTVKLNLRYAHVQLDPSKLKHGIDKAEEQDFNCYAVLVESAEPSDTENTIQWLLLTTLKVESESEAREVIEIYRKRWQIEEYFKTLKSGCHADDIRLQTARKLSRYICMKSVIATEVYQLKEASRERPNDPCDEILTADQWKVLILLIQQLDGKRLRLPKRPPTLDQAAKWIGRLGGHLGRTRDGPPGVTTLWRGYQELLLKTEGYKLALSQL
jgi:hypothetical protein